MWDSEPNNLEEFLPQNKITNKNKVAVQEVNYSNDYVLVPDKECMAHNEKMKNIPPQVLKTSALASHRRHVHKNTPPFRNLIESATEYLVNGT